MNDAEDQNITGPFTYVFYKIGNAIDTIRSNIGRNSRLGNQKQKKEQLGDENQEIHYTFNEQFQRVAREAEEKQKHILSKEERSEIYRQVQENCLAYQVAILDCQRMNWKTFIGFDACKKQVDALNDCVSLEQVTRA